MSKLTILKGLPASGKSTRCQDILSVSGNTVRINKDLLREMLHFKKFSGNNEDLTRQAARVLAKHFLSNDTNVVIDDTNLNSGTLQGWLDLGKELECKTQVIAMDTPYVDCVLRDQRRLNSVGPNVIFNMAMKADLYPKPEKPFVLCDIDGTICDITHRLKYARGEDKDWHKFFSLIPLDKVRKDTLDTLVKYRNKGHEIIFVSARPENYYNLTMSWFEQNGIIDAVRPAGIIMRHESDKRVDTDVKKDFYTKYFKDKYDIHVILDDRPSVIRMWKSLGLKVIDVGQGVEF